MRPDGSGLKGAARSLFEQALDECGIERTFKHKLRVSADAAGTCLSVEGRDAIYQNAIYQDAIFQDAISLDRLRQVRIVSAGKAAAAMLQALLARLPLVPACDLQGVLIAAERPANLPAAIQYFCGGHPVPNAASFAGARAVLAMLDALGKDTPGDISPQENTVRRSAPEETLCIFLLSGGASAMMELPLDAAISLEDTIVFHRALVHSGASIVEMNCVRKHFSAVKGGRLALAAGGARTLSLLVSDVPPEHLDALGSGPTIADPSTVSECREVLARYSLLEHFPASVRRFFATPHLPETPKPGDLVPSAGKQFTGKTPADNQTAGKQPVCKPRIYKLLDSDDLAQAARDHATRLGFHAVIDNACDDWSYDAAADYLLDRLRELRREHARVCLISTGEVTVRVVDSAASARGGRNQHFVLYMATRLCPADGPLAVLSAGSDGIDGASDAAGAIVDERTLDGEGRRESALRALAEFDSSSWLSAIGATLVPGPTGHNLRDLRILLADAAR